RRVAGDGAPPRSTEGLPAPAVDAVIEHDGRIVVRAEPMNIALIFGHQNAFVGAEQDIRGRMQFKRARVLTSDSLVLANMPIPLQHTLYGGGVVMRVGRVAAPRRDIKERQRPLPPLQPMGLPI